MSELEPGTARMTHPDPGVDDVTVNALQVPHLEHAGWRYVEGDREEWPAELRSENQVYIRNLTTGGTAFVPELSGHLRERGWVEVGSDDDQAVQVQRLEDKTVEELRELARDRRLKVSGNKDELLARLAGTEEQDTQDQAGGEPAPSEEEQG